MSDAGRREAGGPAVMRAVVVRAHGSYEKAEVAECPVPTAGAGEILVEIRAAPVNYADLLVIGGTYQFLPPLPFIPGKAPAGIVRAVGPGVGDFAPGDAVLAIAESGGYAEMVSVAASQCYKLPSGLSFVDAAAMAVVFDTAWFALRDRARLAPGETVLVLGASGAIGHACVQLAKAFGARVLAGVSSPAKFEAARAAGADVTIDLSQPDLHDGLRAQVRAATDGRGANIVLDPLGGDAFDAAIRALAWRGRLVVIGFASGRIPTIRANYLMVKNIEVSGLQISDYRKRRPDQMRQCYAELFDLYAAGRLKPAHAVTLPLSEFRTALKMIAERRAPGRLVLLPKS
jgi:NADPH2:quinone reductase